MNILFQRRTENGMIASGNPADVWSDWQGQDERWLFVAPHDDDIVIGAGLTFLAGVQLEIDTYAAVVSNGRMGYCTPSQRETIMHVRYTETQNSFRFLGLHDGHLYQFDYDDGSLSQQMGRRFADNLNDSRVICGAVGLQNTLTWLLRQVKPSRIFMANRLDLHPDHRTVNQEMTISIFHAMGEIWPELGSPIQLLPKLYEYATYSDFAKPPTMRTSVSDDLFEKRLHGIAMYKSQLQIESLVAELRKAGGSECLLEMEFDIMKPGKYDFLFQ